MSLMSKLSLRQLKQNRRRTLLTLLGVILSVGMITAVAGFVFSMRETMRELYVAADGDWHVAIYNVTEAQAAAIEADALVGTSFRRTDGDSGALGIHFRLKAPTREYGATLKLLAARHGVADPKFRDYKEILALEGVIGDDSSLNAVVTLAAIIIGIIVVGSVFVISNAFSISANERIKQFGLMKSVGATRRQIRGLVLSEGLYLAIMGIPVGLVAGYGIEAIALSIANTLLVDVRGVNNGIISFAPVFALVPILIAAAISFATILLSAWLPARRCAKIPAIEAIRLSGEVKIRAKKVRVSRLASRLFGFEATLALKALRRDRRKYRATVVSLVVSMVLFIAGSSFGEMMAKAGDMVYTQYGIDVVAGIRSSEDAALSDGDFDELDARFAAIPGAEIGSARLLNYIVELPNGFVSDAAMKRASFGFPTDPQPKIAIATMDEGRLNQLCEAAGVAREELDADGARGILLNHVIIGANGKRIEFEPFNFTKDMRINFADDDGSQGSVTLAGQIASDAGGLTATINSFNYVAVVLSPKAYARLTLSRDSQSAYWSAKTEDSAAFAAACSALFTEFSNETFGEFENGTVLNCTVHDIARTERTSRNLVLLISIFVHGFVFLLSLIGVTSVVGTISTGIRLREREFATLSSVGMTPAAMRKMLNFESLFYGLRALCIGLPLGLGAAAFMQKALNDVLEFEFIVPWQSLMISVAAVLLITFATMRYAASHLRRKAIVEALKESGI